MHDYFVGRELSAPARYHGDASGFAFRRILGGRHDPAGDLPHVFSGTGELTSQELRLNLHGLLKVGGVNQSSSVFESRLHVLLSER
jgi:hypothetical protein